MNAAIFLDRDGTINEEMGYINHLDRFVVFPFAAQSITIFNNLGFKVIVITNQSGVARGYFEESLLTEIHNQFKKTMSAQNAIIDAIYYCPHHPTEGRGRYKKECNCRKPKPGMVLKAVKEHNLDLKRSFFVSDRYKDILFAKQLEITSALVLTGYGKGEYMYQQKNWKIQPDIIGTNLLHIAQHIANEYS